MRGLEHPLEGWINIEIRRVMLRLLILKKIGEKPTYSYEILKWFSRTPMRKSFIKQALFKSFVYNTIKSMEREGYINSNRKVSGNVMKIYFTLTPKGKTTLKDARKTFNTAMGEMKRLLQ